MHGTDAKSLQKIKITRIAGCKKQRLDLQLNKLQMCVILLI